MSHPLLPGLVSALAAVWALAACTPHPAAAPAREAGLDSAGGADVTYCNQLATLYERFGGPQDHRNEDVDASVAEAVNECHGGRAVDGAERW